MPFPVVPAAIAGVAALGGLIYYERKKHAEPTHKVEDPNKMFPPKAPSPPSAFHKEVTNNGVPLAPKPTTVTVATTNPMTGQKMPVGSPTMVSTVQQSGPANPSARALYTYLKQSGTDDSPQMQSLVKTFQTTTNSDPTASFLHGKLNTDGVYDAATSAALTVYTGDPIPASPNAPPPPAPTPAQVQNPYVPGAASSSGFNLGQYFLAHGVNSADPTQQTLVLQFQRDYNSDPKVYGGPASTISVPTVPKARIPENGIFDSATSKALDVMTIEGSDVWNAYHASGTAKTSGTVTASSLNLRATPNGNIIGSVKQGTVVKINSLSADGAWYNITTPTSQTGFASKQYIS